MAVPDKAVIVCMILCFKIGYGEIRALVAPLIKVMETARLDGYGAVLRNRQLTCLPLASGEKNGVVVVCVKS